MKISYPPNQVRIIIRNNKEDLEKQGYRFYNEKCVFLVSLSVVCKVI
ncbi:DUF3173 domain-containing protein [Lactobacillus mellis]|nr:DUF3173 domain-containing protein [Bombilactobacillus mellis]